ncbi:FMN1 [[Candida] subhashii]|uniref:Riboflavin kinase n=1 Tax=[Candida] subhashii TaxID=561895 RepID=A0A8J5QIH4_9ASCO|nr:FMN1 [[Candida] subhashii]KAG7662668.1 FMN1 [[Candida] subhashii]
MPRPKTDIPEEPQSPFPLVETSTVITGFGRGSSELGIPTANIPINDDINKLDTGIYYGWCRLIPHSGQSDSITHRINCEDQEVVFNHGNQLAGQELDVLPMVMSIGWNPFYHNKSKAAEVHIMHKFDNNFYGADIKFAVLGYIRPELDYTTKAALIEDINLDIKIAVEILERDAYMKFRTLVA